MVLLIEKSVIGDEPFRRMKQLNAGVTSIGNFDARPVMKARPAVVIRRGSLRQRRIDIGEGQKGGGLLYAQDVRGDLPA